MSSNNPEVPREGEVRTASSSKAAQPTPENTDPKTVSDKGVIPHVTTSALHVAEVVAKGVKEAVTEAVAWADKKVDKLSETNEDGTGPYGSPATCAPSDFDVIATGVLPGMLSEAVTARKDSKQEGVEKTDEKND
ncbi:hypothetical protein P280DRAFT_526603 [Massarina eburnea CBS 473.64]|uniref:Uncharacterized protein n=1 Tax=Massarina eburnea CBS 473.64 TaxID=1395130 RepID=A0A6A6RYK4_9PLEO|nr:hypothetical protein P280DRAFT_526603 [Massarina eburnea CBS 473.64]